MPLNSRTPARPSKLKNGQSLSQGELAETLKNSDHYDHETKMRHSNERDKDDVDTAEEYNMTLTDRQGL